MNEPGHSAMRHALHVATRGRLALLLTIPVLVSGVTWVVARQAGQQAGWVKHTLLVELSVERVLTDFERAENSQRGYLLTGEERFIEPYQGASEDAHRQLAELRNLTSDNVQQQRIVAQLAGLLDRRLGQIDSSMQLYRAGASEIAGKAGVEPGKQLRDTIRSLARGMYDEEERLLHVRERALATTAVLFRWLLGLGCGLILLAGISLYQDVKRYSQQTKEAEDRLSTLNAKLEQSVRDRTASLQAREELLSIFVKHVPAAVAMLDRDMRYLQVSERWCTDYKLDSSQLLGRSHYEVFPDLPERWRAIHQSCLAGITLRQEEDRFDRVDASTIWLRWEIRPWGEKDGLPEGILIFSEDITQRKRTEEKLQESEATMRALLDAAPQAILAVDPQGEIVMANRMAGLMFDYNHDELLGKDQEILLPERLKQRHRAHRAEFASHPDTRPMGIGLELVGVRKDGSEFPIEVSLSSVPTNRGPLAVSIVSDITLRKQSEIALRNSEQQLRALAGGLLKAQEEERRRVARELHDDITQRLAFLSIELGKLEREVPDSLENVRARLATLRNQTLNASSEVRRLSHALHPSVISDFGLSVALEEFFQEFEEVHGARVRFEGFVEDSQLGDAAATCLYRIAQESLRNAVVHGQASEIGVTLHLVDDFIQLEVTDNGQGFGDVPSKPGLGIISMRERIRLVNGKLLVSSELGRGTKLTASVPVTGGRNESNANSAG